tara:strand:+ start:511 stop:1026 length:516 start_codon:yes stop_codon:yes gene_type:complete
MKKEVKSQAALEFLTTYAWAFLGILITIGALYYFGIFDFSKFLPQKCLFPSQFECLDFSFVGEPTNEVRFKLVNNMGEPIDVDATGYTLTDDAGSTLCTGAPGGFSWPDGQEEIFTFSGCTGGSFVTKSRAEAKISITYCAPATAGCTDIPPNPSVQHIVKGKITAVVNSP